MPVQVCSGMGSISPRYRDQPSSTAIPTSTGTDRTVVESLREFACCRSFRSWLFGLVGGLVAD